VVRGLNDSCHPFHPDAEIGGQVEALAVNRALAVGDGEFARSNVFDPAAGKPFTRSRKSFSQQPHCLTRPEGLHRFRSRLSWCREARHPASQSRQPRGPRAIRTQL